MTKSRTISRRAMWAFVALVCLATGGRASVQGRTAASPSKFDEVVRHAVAEGRSLRAIVRFTSETARTRGASIVAARGGKVHRVLNAIGGLTVDIDAVTAAALAADTGTMSISIDAQVRANGMPPQRSAVAPSGANNLKKYKPGHRSISVAVIDSGVRPHVDLPAGRIRKFVDFVNGQLEPYDDFGHGTHVAGIVAGTGAASLHLEEPYAGAAPEVDVVALKVLDANGSGRTSDVVAALEWVAANHIAYDIRVVNLSLGHPIFEPAATDPLVQAAEALVRRGIVVVASAGNLGINSRTGQPGNGGTTSPANGPGVIAVGAVDNKGTQARNDDTVPDYSSRGPTRFDLIVKPDLVASGHRVVSLSAPGSILFTNYPALHVVAGAERAAAYMVLSGTSMAAPAVAGTAASMLSVNPALSAGTVRAVLEFTAQHLPDTNLMTQGAGSLNAPGAVRLARLIEPRASVGEIWLKSHKGAPQSFDMIGVEEVQWSKHIIWGDGVLMGDAAYLHMAAWDDNIVWGQDLDSIVWGQCDGEGCDNTVWGEATLDNIVWGQATLESIVWGQCATSECSSVVWGQGADSIVWGQRAENIVWGQCEGGECNSIVWGQDGMSLGYWAVSTVQEFWADVVDWTQVSRAHVENIVWGQAWLENIVWGQCGDVECHKIVWGQSVLTGGTR